MKTFFTSLLATFLGLLSSSAFARIDGDNNTNYAARGIQTQAVYYRDASFDQPLIGAKMELTLTRNHFGAFACNSRRGRTPRF